MSKGVKVVSTIDLANAGFQKALSRASYAAMEEMGYEMLKDITPFVPKKTGLLRQNGKYEVVSSGGNKVGLRFTWSRWRQGRQIAGSVYEGINPFTGQTITKWTTAGTGPYWVERAENQYLNSGPNGWLSRYTYSWLNNFKNNL